MTADTEKIEKSARENNDIIHRISSDTWTATQAREYRFMEGHLRGQTSAILAVLNKRPDMSGPEYEETRGHLVRAAALNDDRCDYLDAVLKRLEMK